MSGVLIVIVAFIACSSLIVVAGVRLSRDGDVIAEKTGMGGPRDASRWPFRGMP